MLERFRQIPSTKEYLAKKAALRRTADANFVAHWSQAFDLVPESSNRTPTESPEQTSLNSAKEQLQIVLSNLYGLKPLSEDGVSKKPERLQVVYRILKSEGPVLTRVTNTMARRGLNTLETIATLSDHDIDKTHQIGKQSARIIKAMREVAKAELRLEAH